MSKQIKIRVLPRSSKNQIIKQPDGFKIKLKAPPVDGEANKELIKFLSKEWGVAKSRIEIVKGKTSRNKVVKIT